MAKRRSTWIPVPPPLHWHPLVVEMLKALPPPGTRWERAAMEAWYDTFCAVVRFVYGQPGKERRDDDDAPF